MCRVCIGITFTSNTIMPNDNPPMTITPESQSKHNQLTLCFYVN